MNFLQSAAPVSFVYAKDRDKTLDFYCKTLGLRLRSSDPFGDFLDLGGGLARITVMPDHAPSPHPVLGWNVADITATAKALRELGVVFTIHEGMGQDALGIWTSPD